MFLGLLKEIQRIQDCLQSPKSVYLSVLRSGFEAFEYNMRLKNYE